MRTRRTFLRHAAGTMLGAAAVPAVWSASPSAVTGHFIPPDLHDYDCFIGRVKFDSDLSAGDPWNIQPVGETYLLDEFSQVVRCQVKLFPELRRNRPGRGDAVHFNAVLDLNYAHHLHKFPFLFMTAGGHYAFNDTQKKNFKDYVDQGGFMLMDDCVSHGPGDFFYQSSCRMLEEVFGKTAVKTIGTQHEIFHNMYDLSQIGMPYVQGTQLPPRGIFVGDRLAVLLSATDIHCGWADRTQTWFGPNVPNRFGGRGLHGYDESIKMGINLMMYVLSH
ncbi:MAG: DUF4159 domain-containing protein [Phycisphaerae bacterium]|nr:DUF4159 domain-containing protein [Phycisphaerae bacterium]